MKVSFDFDSTLSTRPVQVYASNLIKRGFEVWIVTSRLEPSKAPRPNYNDDLFEIANLVGIKNIKFTNFENKSEFLKDKGFIFHLDDDVIELSFVKTDTDVTPVSYFKNPNWKKECENAIENKKN